MSGEPGHSGLATLVVLRYVTMIRKRDAQPLDFRWFVYLDTHFHPPNDMCWWNMALSKMSLLYCGGVPHVLCLFSSIVPLQSGDITRYQHGFVAVGRSFLHHPILWKHRKKYTGDQVSFLQSDAPIDRCVSQHVYKRFTLCWSDQEELAMSLQALYKRELQLLEKHLSRGRGLTWPNCFSDMFQVARRIHSIGWALQ